MFATNFSTIDWAIVILYLIGSGFVGVIVNRYVHNVRNYMVAGGGTGTALNIATFIGTGLCLVTIMYAAIDGFHRGFAFMIVAVIGVIVGLLLGSTGIAIRPLREAGLVTIPEYFQKRYNRRVRVTAGIICAVAGILNMGLFPKMGATFLTYTTGLGQTGSAVAAPADPAAPKADAPAAAKAESAASAETAPPAALDHAAMKAHLSRQEVIVNIVTSVLIAIVLVYTVLGGMVSVIVTDYLQFIILSIGLGVGLLYCLFGPAELGWGNMVTALKTHRGEAAFNPVHAGSYGWLWLLWMVVHFAAAAVCWAPEASRALTAKDPKATQRTFFFAAPGQFFRLALPALLAIAAFTYIAHHAELAAYFFPNGLSAKGTHAEQAMPLIMGKILPAGLIGLLVAGGMAAFMSTHDSYLLCWSSIITRDVILPLRRKGLTDRQQIGITRVIILIIGAFLLVWGVWYPLPESVWNYMAVTGSVWLCGGITALMGGMYWRRASSAGAFAALLGGLASVVIIFLPDRMTSNTMLMGIVGLANYAFCVVVFIVFSLLLPDKPGQQEA